MTTEGTSDVTGAAWALHRSALAAWNDCDAAAFAALFTEDGNVVGFDGSMVDGRDAIRSHLEGIFADHHPAAYVGKVREVRELSGTGAVLLRAVVGMVPPGADDLNPDVNAVQCMVAVPDDGDATTLRIALLQSTPAAFHGRPDEVGALTAELRHSR